MESEDILIGRLPAESTQRFQASGDSTSGGTQPQTGSPGRGGGKTIMDVIAQACQLLDLPEIYSTALMRCAKAI